MTDTSPITQDPVTGQFLPGNIWKMPAWRPGKSGHTARYTPNRLINICTEYVIKQKEEAKSLTWAGLARHMGLSRPALDKYSKGNIGNDKPGIVSVLEYMKTIMEEEKEQRLEDRDYATAGVIKALQALDPEKWGDNKKIEVDIKQQISIAIDPDSALGKRLNSAGVTIDQHLDTLEGPSNGK